MFISISIIISDSHSIQAILFPTPPKQAKKNKPKGNIQFKMNRNQGWKSNYKVPAFGNWDYEYDYNYDDDNQPYTQRFESARQAGLIRYGSYLQPQPTTKDRDLYVAGDLYQNDIVTPAFIVLPPTRKKGLGNPNQVIKEQEKTMQKKQMWGGYNSYLHSYDYSYDTKTMGNSCPILSSTIKPKAIDEDLYKISSDFLHAKPKRRRSTLGFFSSCLLPNCI